MLIGSATMTRCLGLGGLNPKFLYGVVLEQGASMVGFLVRPLCLVLLSLLLTGTEGNVTEKKAKKEGRAAGGRRMLFLFQNKGIIINSLP